MKPRAVVGVVRLCGVFVALACASPARAELIAVDHLSRGDGLLTLDSATNLRWLDLTRTGNLSPREVRELLRTPGSSLYGFRLASQPQVDQLMADAGIPQRGNGGWSTENADGARLLEELVGVTGMFGLSPGGIGAPLAGIRYTSAGYFRRVTPFGPDIGTVNWETWWDGTHWAENYPDIPFLNGIRIGQADVLGVGGGALPFVGHWLVVAPEPASVRVLLLGIGLLVLMKSRIAESRSGR